MDIYDVINIDKHIDITITSLRKTHLGDCIFLETDMYIDRIKVNHYKFQKELEEGYGRTNIWILENKDIFHKLTNEVIQEINDWSSKITKLADENKSLIEKNKKIEKQRKHDLEEHLLKEAFDDYKQKS